MCWRWVFSDRNLYRKTTVFEPLVWQHRGHHHFQQRQGKKANIFPSFSDLQATAIFQLTTKPGLPIFGTVSAATALVPSPNNAVSFPGRVSEIMKYGFPGMDNIRSYSDYVLSYDRRNRVAHWTFEHLTPSSVEANGSVDRSKSECKFLIMPSNGLDIEMKPIWFRDFS